MASLISLLIVAAVLFLVAWAVEAYLPVPETPKRILIFIVVLIFCLYLLRWAGIF